MDFACVLGWWRKEYIQNFGVFFNSIWKVENEVEQYL
jgi:hypothetical protein